MRPLDAYCNRLTMSRGAWHGRGSCSTRWCKRPPQQGPRAMRRSSAREGGSTSQRAGLLLPVRIAIMRMSRVGLALGRGAGYLRCGRADMHCAALYHAHRRRATSARIGPDVRPVAETCRCRRRAARSPQTPMMACRRRLGAWRIPMSADLSLRNLRIMSCRTMLLLQVGSQTLSPTDPRARQVTFDSFDFDAAATHMTYLVGGPAGGRRASAGGGRGGDGFGVQPHRWQ